MTMRDARYRQVTSHAKCLALGVTDAERHTRYRALVLQDEDGQVITPAA